MSDFFSRTTTFKGATTAEMNKVTLSGGSQLVLQQLDVVYSQDISRLYALESTDVYLVQGKTEGKFHAKSALCNSGGVEGLASLANICNASTNNMDVGPVSLKTCVLTSISLSVSTGDFVLYNDLTGLFVSLEANKTKKVECLETETAERKGAGEGG